MDRWGQPFTAHRYCFLGGLQRSEPPTRGDQFSASGRPLSFQEARDLPGRLERPWVPSPYPPVIVPECQGLAGAPGQAPRCSTLLMGLKPAPTGLVPTRSRVLCKARPLRPGVPRTCAASSSRRIPPHPPPAHAAWLPARSHLEQEMPLQFASAAKNSAGRAPSGNERS